MSSTAAPPPGFYERPDGRLQWWDGAEWTDRFDGSPVATPAPEVPGREVLERMVEKYVRNGYSIEFRSDRRVVLAKRRPVRVLLNVGLTLVTGGFWLLILAIRLLNWPSDRVALQLDEHGSLIPEFS